MTRCTAAPRTSCRRHRRTSRVSESPRYVGRAVVALASDPDRARWNQQSVNSGQLALEYGFTDLDGSQPDVWRYIEEIRENDLEADFADYR